LWHHTYVDASLCELPAWSPPAAAVGVNGVHAPATGARA
jgi:hypothetical protein